MKKVLIGVVILVVLGVLAYLYVFHKPHRDIESESADFQVASTMLVEEYTNAEDNANSIYLDHVVEVRGVVEEQNDEALVLEGGVVCHFLESENPGNIEVGTEVTVKGRVVGYDPLFGEVRMDNCNLVE